MFIKTYRVKYGTLVLLGKVLTIPVQKHGLSFSVGPQIISLERYSLRILDKVQMTLVGLLYSMCYNLSD